MELSPRRMDISYCGVPAIGGLAESTMLRHGTLTLGGDGRAAAFRRLLTYGSYGRTGATVQEFG